MIPRIHTHKHLESLLKQFPAVALVGARQTGKTTLASQVAEKMGSKAVFFDLEKTRDRLRLADPETALSEYSDKCVVIDEAQSMPGLFTALRPLIDANRKPGRFLLLGSVSPLLAKGISESLAGRIAYIELSPVNVTEAVAAGKTVEQLWFRGGYPEALTLKTHTQWSRWAENYFTTFIQRDVNFLTGEVLSPTLVNNMWQMLSGMNGNILHNEMLARSLGISRPTVSRYLDFLESSFIIHRMQPWFINVSKRVVRSQKIYFRDTGILHYLNRIDTPAGLRTNIVAGGSWEGFVVEQVRQLKNPALSIHYYRTHHGAETDIVLIKGSRPVCCIEIKLGTTPHLSKGWQEVIRDMKTTTNFIVTSGNDDYPFDKFSRVCGLEVFLSRHLPRIK